MVSRIFLDDEEQATALATRLDEAELEVALITLKDGDQADEPATFMVATSASAAAVREIIGADFEIVAD